MKRQKHTNKKDPANILDYKEPITRIYLVRHGQTNANKNGLLFGQLDWDLNNMGLKQAKHAANKLFRTIKNKKIHHLISSPLRRAHHTAKIISKKLHINNIITYKDLMEKAEGSWEAKSYWQVREDDFKNFSIWIKDPIKNKPPNGESISELDSRVKNFYKSLLKKYKGKNIIIVSHSGPIKILLLNLLGLNIDKFWSLKIDCGSCSEILVSNKHFIITSLNNF